MTTRARAFSGWLVLTILFVRPVAAKVLEVSEIFQEQTAWCWAATSHCVLDYYGIELQQCQIVEYAFDRGDCCESPGSCNQTNCMQGSGCMSDAIDHWGIQTAHHNSELSLAEATATIEDDRPFIMGMCGQGHVVVGHGIEGNTVYFMDPWMTEGFKTGDYDYLTSYAGGNWCETLEATSEYACDCEGVSACCDGCKALADGTACSDPSPCAQQASCQAGVCVGSNLSDGTPCNDGSACTLVDICQGGVCLGTQETTCQASDACHDPGVCDPATGICSDPPRPDGSLCNDNNACTQVDSCLQGVCTGGNPVICVPVTACHDAGVCDPQSGVCSQPIKPAGAPCEDGDLCTSGESCTNGLCIGGTPLICEPLDSCHDAGVCEPGTGQCTHPAKIDGSSCEDGNPCTQQDACRAGACLGGPPVTCPPPGPCQLQGTCDPAQGGCQNPSLPDNTPCDDGSLCTLGESCQAGNCLAGEFLTCDDGDPCTLDSCDAQQGCIFEEWECVLYGSCGCGSAAPSDGLLGMLLLGGLLLLRRKT